MCFFLFWLISLPAIWFPIHQMYVAICHFSSRIIRNARLHAITSRHLFTVKAVVAPTAGIVFFIWCIVKAKGVGPIISQPSTVHGSELGWGMIVSIMSCISNMVTLVVQVFLYPNRDWETRLTNVCETGMPRILHLEQRRHPLRFTPSSSRSRSRSRLSAS